MLIYLRRVALGPSNSIQYQQLMLGLRLVRAFSVDLHALYKGTVETKGFNYDPKQVKIIQDLQRLNDDLIRTDSGWQRFAQSLRDDPPPEYKDMNTQEQKQQRRKNFFNFFSREFSTAQPIRVRGLYLYGGSGCGKSFLSEMFFRNLAIQNKSKVHFHEFMGNIHAELFKLEKEKKGFEPLHTVAKRTAKKTRLLFLDEFQVTDVADASILKRLFEQLLNNELVLLATSNRKPENLYKNGHQRQFFVPFIDFLNERCEVINMDSHKDYRYDLQKDRSDNNLSYISPIDDLSQEKVDRILAHLTNTPNPELKEAILEPVPGRKLKVPRTCNQVCLYYFHELMESVMGDSDFRIICKNYKAIIIRNMRPIKKGEGDTANRLIKLFDEAYYRNVKIYIEAAVGIDDLIAAGSEDTVVEEEFAMTRCKSRLIQFQTIHYKEQPSYIETLGSGPAY